MKIILHLCADLGSDSRYYQLDCGYDVILVGKEIGVENFNPPNNVHGIIANPVCTEFSTANNFNKIGDLEKGMFLVRHCQRIIELSKPKWWVIENPANGRLKELIGMPKAVYQPWEYGSPYTKKTALWGDFIMPTPLFKRWDDVPKNSALYIKPNRKKPAMDGLHKSALKHLEEFYWAEYLIKTDADFRSLCSDGFAREFYKTNN